MKHYYLYTRSLLKHIYYVRKMCWQNGLYWQGLVHDLSKWRLSEFIPYAQYFYWSQKKKDKETLRAIVKFGYSEAPPYGYYVKDRFNFAWLHHQNRNKHHWQYWVRLNDDGKVVAMPIPEKYVKEMLCDWWGASTAYGYKGANLDWYNANKDKMQLHPKTRVYVEKAIRNSESAYDLPPYNS